jgi:hypothetical protein
MNSRHAGVCAVCRRLMVLGLVCVPLATAGCASRAKAKTLSEAVGKGIVLHEQFDATIYKGYADALQSDSALRVHSTRNQLEGTRQKYLLLGELRLLDGLRTTLQREAAEFETSGKTDFGTADSQLVKAIADLQKTPANPAPAAAAAAHWKDLADKYQGKRKEELDKRLDQFAQHEEAWRQTVQTRFDDATRQVDAIETQLGDAFKDVNANITSLQNHYAAIKAGQEEVTAYLNERTAIELTLQGILKGVGINVSLSQLGSISDSVTSKLQGRLNTVVDRLNAQLTDSK